MRQLTNERTRGQDVWGIFVVRSRSSHGPPRITALLKLWTPGISAGEAHGVRRFSLKILALSNPTLTSSKFDITSGKASWYCCCVLVCSLEVSRALLQVSSWLRRGTGFIFYLYTSVVSFYLQASNRLLAPMSRKRMSGMWIFVELGFKNHHDKCGAIMLFFSFDGGRFQRSAFNKAVSF